MTAIRFATWAVIVGAALCAGAGCGSDTDDRPVSFSYIHATIIDPGCTTVGCHNAFAAAYGFGLETREGAYSILVGAPCDEGEPPTDPLDVFLRPGDPERSRVLKMIEGDDVALRMPPDEPLPEADIELVRQWILEGALCN